MECWLCENEPKLPDQRYALPTQRQEGMLCDAQSCLGDAGLIAAALRVAIPAQRAANNGHFAHVSLIPLTRSSPC